MNTTAKTLVKKRKDRTDWRRSGHRETIRPLAASNESITCPASIRVVFSEGHWRVQSVFSKHCGHYQQSSSYMTPRLNRAEKAMITAMSNANVSAASTAALLSSQSGSQQ